MVNVDLSPEQIERGIQRLQVLQQDDALTDAIKFEAICRLPLDSDGSDPLGERACVGLRVSKQSGQVWTFDGDDYDAWAAEIANQVRAQVHEAVGMAIAEAVAVEPTAEAVAA